MTAGDWEPGGRSAPRTGVEALLPVCYFAGASIAEAELSSRRVVAESVGGQMVARFAESVGDGDWKVRGEMKREIRVRVIW